MTKILLVSDNHFDMRNLQKALNDNLECDHYFHCGDSEFTADKLRPFVSVRGNNDYDHSYPKEIIFEIEGHRILMYHGSYYEEAIVDKAKYLNCDTVFYGHTHIFNDTVKDGVRLINPGSLRHNRDYSKPCYARVTIDGKDISVERVEID